MAEIGVVMPDESKEKPRLSEQIRQMGFSMRFSLVDDIVVMTATHSDGRVYVIRGDYREFGPLLKDLARQTGALDESEDRPDPTQSGDI